MGGQSEGRGGGRDNAETRGCDFGRGERVQAAAATLVPGLEGLLTTTLCLTAPLTPPTMNIALRHYRAPCVSPPPPPPPHPPAEHRAKQRRGSHVQPDPRGGVGVHIGADQLTDQSGFHTM